MTEIPMLPSEATSAPGGAESLPHGPFSVLPPGMPPGVAGMRGPRKPIEENAVAKAIREQLKKMLEEPYTAKGARKVARVAGLSIKLLGAITNDASSLAASIRPPGFPSLLSSSYYPGGQQPPGEEWEQDAGSDSDEATLSPAMPAMAYSSNAETFGSSSVREFLSALPKLFAAKHRDPEGMVNAIAAAKREGLLDVAERLKKQLAKDLGDDEDEAPKACSLPHIFTPPPPNLTGLCTHPSSMIDSYGKCVMCVTSGLVEPKDATPEATAGAGGVVALPACLPF